MNDLSSNNLRRFQALHGISQTSILAGFGFGAAGVNPLNLAASLEGLNPVDVAQALDLQDQIDAAHAARKAKNPRYPFKL